MAQPHQVPAEWQRPILRDEYDRMVEAGVFGDDRVELLHGVIVAMPPRGPSHDSALELLTELLVPALLGRARVRVQSAFSAGDRSEPEPDLAVVPREDHGREHPDRAHLIVEVAASSLDRDRGVKAALYAERDVPEYWVVNVVDRQIEVHTEIVRGRYTRVVPCRAGDRIHLVAFPDVELRVEDVLP